MLSNLNTMSAVPRPPCGCVGGVSVTLPGRSSATGLEFGIPVIRENTVDRLCLESDNHGHKVGSGLGTRSDTAEVGSSPTPEDALHYADRISKRSNEHTGKSANYAQVANEPYRGELPPHIAAFIRTSRNQDKSLCSSGLQYCAPPQINTANNTEAPPPVERTTPGKYDLAAHLSAENKAPGTANLAASPSAETKTARTAGLVTSPSAETKAPRTAALVTSSSAETNAPRTADLVTSPSAETKALGKADLAAAPSVDSKALQTVKRQCDVSCSAGAEVKPREPYAFRSTSNNARAQPTKNRHKHVEIIADRTDCRSYNRTHR